MEEETIPQNHRGFDGGFGQKQGGYGYGNSPQSFQPEKQINTAMLEEENSGGNVDIGEMDRKINDMQRTLDTDYTMSRVVKMQLRRDLNKLRAERNRLFPNH